MSDDNWSDRLEDEEEEEYYFQPVPNVQIRLQKFEEFMASLNFWMAAFPDLGIDKNDMIEDQIAFFFIWILFSTRSQRPDQTTKV